MRAAIWTRYGPPEGLMLKDIEKPSPRDNEVLIKVHAATVTAGDCEVRSLKMPLFLGYPLRIYAGIRRPKRITILGQELSGEIVEIGKNVKRFKVGDHVFGTPGLGSGSYAEYIRMPEETDMGVLGIKPKEISHEEAACSVIGGLEALHFLGKCNIQKGRKLLINGAGGSIGTFALQYASTLGASITAVDTLEKAEMLLSLGAEKVIDFTKEDFTKNGEKYDVIFDVVGRAPYSRSLRSLKKGGCLAIANPNYSKMFRSMFSSVFGSRNVIIKTSEHTHEVMKSIGELIGSGTVKPCIDREYVLEKIVEAHRYVETGRKKGNVVIKVV